MNESIVKAVKEMIEAPSCCLELETAGDPSSVEVL